MRQRRARFTIRQLMAAVILAAILLWLLRYADSVPFVVALGGFVPAWTGWALVRGRRLRAAVCFVASVVAANALVAPMSVYWSGSWWVIVSVAIGLFAGIPMILGFGTAWSFADTRWFAAKGHPPKVSRLLLSLFLALSLAVTPLFTLWTFWPLRVAFLVSRPFLERIADRVAAGQPVSFPVQAGVYRIVGSATDPRTGNVGLIIDPNPSGRSGFVRYQPGATSGLGGGPFYNLFMGMRLSARWAFEFED